MDNIKNLLAEIGFSESEAQILLQTIENGPSTVAELATKSNLSRQAAYLACEKLLAEGLISEVQRGTKRLIVPEKPSKILVFARRRLADFQNKIENIENKIPELELRARTGKPVVTLYEGQAALVDLFQKLQGKGEIRELYELVDADAMHNVVDRSKLIAARGDLAKKIRNKKAILIDSREEMRKEAKKREDYFLLPDKFGNFDANITVADDYILFATFEGKIFSAIIESKPIAKAMKILFKLALSQIKNEYDQR